MLSRNVLITGCNRGLGFEFVKQLAAAPSPPENIIATYRNPETASELQSLAQSYSTIKLLNIDVRDESSYDTFQRNVYAVVGKVGLNLLINNAGVAPRSTRINMVTWSQMEETLLVNTITPLFVTKTVLPLLKVAASMQDGSNLDIRRAAVINISSVLGSMTYNDMGGLYPYRASKAALNAITKSMSVDLRPYKILVASMHPGWVKTHIGGKQAPLTTEESVSQMLKVLKDLNKEHNGAFVQYDGQILSW